MNTPPTGWEGLLAEGETILWQGRPGTRIQWAEMISVESLIGFVLVSFGQNFGMGPGRSLAQIGPAGLLFPLVGLALFAFGLYLMAGRLVWDAYRRKHSWYTLSDRAAYIASAPLGKQSLHRYETSRMTTITLDDTTPGTLWFADEFTAPQAATRATVFRKAARLKPRRIGFQQIDDAHRVHALLMQQRQTGTP